MSLSNILLTIFKLKSSVGRLCFDAWIFRMNIICAIYNFQSRLYHLNWGDLLRILFPFRNSNDTRAICVIIYQSYWQSCSRLGGSLQSASRYLAKLRLLLHSSYFFKHYYISAFWISTCGVGSDFYANVGKGRHPIVSRNDSRGRFSFGLTDVFNDAFTETGGESLRWSGDVVDSAEASWTLLYSRDQYGGESEADISTSTRREHAANGMGGPLAVPEISNLS